MAPLLKAGKVTVYISEITSFNELDWSMAFLTALAMSLLRSMNDCVSSADT